MIDTLVYLLAFFGIISLIYLIVLAIIAMPSNNVPKNKEEFYKWHEEKKGK